MDLQQITDQLVTVDSGQAFFYLLGLQLYIILCQISVDFSITLKYGSIGP